MQNHMDAKIPVAIHKYKSIGLSNDPRELAAENC